MRLARGLVLVRAAVRPEFAAALVALANPLGGLEVLVLGKVIGEPFRSRALEKRAGSLRARRVSNLGVRTIVARVVQVIAVVLSRAAVAELGVPHRVDLVAFVLGRPRARQALRRNFKRARNVRRRGIQVDDAAAQGANRIALGVRLRNAVRGVTAAAKRRRR